MNFDIILRIFTENVYNLDESTELFENKCIIIKLKYYSLK